MDSEQLIELTRDLIDQATHFNVPYVKEVYSDNLLIVKVDQAGLVDTMNKEQLMSFVQGNKDTNAEPLSSKTDYHYAVGDERTGMVVITRELILDGKLNRKFFTVFWEYSAGRWQVVKESALALN